MIAYNEDFYNNVARGQIEAAYAEANRQVDGATVVWGARTERRVCEQGISYDQSLSQTLKELRQSLGLPVNPNLPGQKLPPISIQGFDFTVGGKLYKVKECSDFISFYRFLKGEDITEVVKQRKQLGFDTLRVGGMFKNIVNFRPQDFSNFYSRLGDYATFLDDLEMRFEFFIFADAQDVMPNIDSQRTHFNKVNEVLIGRANVFEELGNEYGDWRENDWSKNGFNPNNFMKPQGIMYSAGSGTGDVPPIPIQQDYGTFHCRRDGEEKYFAKCIADIADSGVIYYGWDTYPGMHKPWIHNEPKGFAEVRKSGSRSDSIREAYSMGWMGTRFDNGICYHSDQGIQSQLFTNKQLACAEAFVIGCNDAMKFQED